MTLFVDTWGWLAFRTRREAMHLEVKKIYLHLLKQQGKIVTTDYVLDETFTLLFKRMPYELACESIEFLKQAEKNNFLYIEWITPERFENALALRKKFKDKPGISFTDITSMTVMNELGIEKIITADQHFCQVGFPFQLLP